MTFGNKLLLALAIIQIQQSTLYASQALCKTSEALCEDFHRQLSITIENTAECIAIAEETVEEAPEQELRNKVCEEGLSEPERLAHDSSQNCQSEQELKNKVHEEVVSKSSADQTAACLSKESIAVAQSAVQKDVQGSVIEKLAFSDADVRHYLDERSIAYDTQHQVSIKNGKAACTLAACQTLALQKNEKGMSFFIPCEITAPVLITNPGITQVKVIRASPLITNPGITQAKAICASAGKKRKKRWIEVYLGYNPQLQTIVGSDKIYEASILLLQKSLPSPLSRKVVQSQPPTARN